MNNTTKCICTKNNTIVSANLKIQWCSLQLGLLLCSKCNCGCMILKLWVNINNQCLSGHVSQCLPVTMFS